MKTVPTAEEFMTDEYQIKHYGTILLKPKQAAIEFAKFHVQEALKQASIKAKEDITKHEGFATTAILNSYPLENIK